MDMTFSKQVNLLLLEEELRRVLPEALYQGATQMTDAEGRSTLTLIFAGETLPAAVQTQANAIVVAHDANRRTARQEADAARETQREQFRQNPLPLDTYASAQAPIKLLAERVAWLEAEMLRLAGSSAGGTDVQ